MFTTTIIKETAADLAGLLFSSFTLKLIALGSCPVVLIVLAKAALGGN